MELENQTSQVVQEVTATKDEFTPYSVKFIGLELNTKNLNSFLQVAGYDLPEGYIDELYTCLRSRVKPLEFPKGAKPYAYLMASEEKKYKILPVDSKNRVTVEEEILLDLEEAGMPTVTLHSGDMLGDFEFEAVFDASNNDEAWDFLDRLAALGSNLTPSEDELLVSDLNGDRRNYSFVGEDVSIVFIKKGSLVLPKANPDIKFEEMWVPYDVQLVGASEEVEKTLAGQLGSEKMDFFLQSGALSVIKGAISNPDEIPDLPLDLIKMVKNADSSIHFAYSSDIIVESEDLYSEDECEHFYDEDECDEEGSYLEEDDDGSYVDGEDSYLEDDDDGSYVEGDDSYVDEEDSYLDGSYVDDEEFDSAFSEDEEYTSSFGDEIDGSLSDGQQSASSFLAVFNDSEIGTVSLNIGNTSFFDPIDEFQDGDILCRTGKVTERRMVEVFWTLLDTVPDKAILEKFSSMAKKCVEAIGVKDYDEKIKNPDTIVITGIPNAFREAEFSKDGFKVTVKLKKVGYPEDSCKIS